MSSTDRVLVTGAAGFVGRHVVEQLHRERWAEVLSLEHAWRDAAHLADLLAGQRIDRCIHLGWYASPHDVFTSEAGNLASLHRSIELVDALRVMNCRHLVVAGTRSEYAPSEQPLSEDDPIRPWSVYGATKAALHLLLQSSWRPAGMRVAWARLFNVSGPGERPERLLPIVAQAMFERREIALTPGFQTRDYLDVADAASALVVLSEQLTDGVFNVSSGRGITVRELVTRLVRRFDRTDLLNFGALPYRTEEEMFAVGCNDRLRHATGWHPATKLDDMIVRVIEDVRHREENRDRAERH